MQNVFRWMTSKRPGSDDHLNLYVARLRERKIYQKKSVVCMRKMERETACVCDPHEDDNVRNEYTTTYLREGKILLTRVHAWMDQTPTRSR